MKHSIWTSKSQVMQFKSFCLFPNFNYHRTSCSTRRRKLVLTSQLDGDSAGTARRTGAAPGGAGAIPVVGADVDDGSDARTGTSGDLRGRRGRRRRRAGTRARASARGSEAARSSGAACGGGRERRRAGATAKQPDGVDLVARLLCFFSDCDK